LGPAGPVVFQVSLVSDFLHFPLVEMRSEPFGTSPTVFFETQPVIVAALALPARKAMLIAATTERKTSLVRCREGTRVFIALMAFLSF
jgi:hypothetical protein